MDAADPHAVGGNVVPVEPLLEDAVHGCGVQRYPRPVLLGLSENGIVYLKVRVIDPPQDGLRSFSREIGIVAFAKLIRLGASNEEEAGTIILSDKVFNPQCDQFGNPAPTVRRRPDQRAVSEFLRVRPKASHNRKNFRFAEWWGLPGSGAILPLDGFQSEFDQSMSAR